MYPTAIMRITGMILNLSKSASHLRHAFVTSASHLCQPAPHLHHTSITIAIASRVQHTCITPRQHLHHSCEHCTSLHVLGVSCTPAHPSFSSSIIINAHHLHTLLSTTSPSPSLSRTTLHHCAHLTTCILPISIQLLPSSKPPLYLHHLPLYHHHTSIIASN